MIVISSREFRENQKKYFDLVDKNEQVIVQRGKDKSYKLVSVPKETKMYSEDEFYYKIEKSLEQIKDGETTKFTNLEEFKKFLEL